jgi:hypothetical protein
MKMMGLRGVIPMTGDPRIDGGGYVFGPMGFVWIPPGPLPWEGMNLALEFMKSLHDSLEEPSDEAFQQAVVEHAPTLAKLYRKSAGNREAALHQKLIQLQEQLREPGANKTAILKQIHKILEELGE